MAKWGPSMRESSGSLSSSSRSIAHSSTAKAASTASPVFPARFPEPDTKYDRSGLTSVNSVGLTSFNPVGLTSPNPVGESGIYLLRTRGLGTSASPIPGVRLGGLAPLGGSTVLGGLAPRTGQIALGGLPLTSATFHDFRTHEPRIWIDGLSTSPGRFIARVSASVATTEGCTVCGSIAPAADTVFG